MSGKKDFDLKPLGGGVATAPDEPVVIGTTDEMPDAEDQPVDDSERDDSERDDRERDDRERDDRERDDRERDDRERETDRLDERAEST